MYLLKDQTSNDLLMKYRKDAYNNIKKRDSLKKYFFINFIQQKNKFY